jgi:hypothetical protein
LAQLSEYHLIDWTPLKDHSGMGLLSGFARINNFGVKVLEGGVASPISVSIDKSRRITVPPAANTDRAEHSAPAANDYGGTRKSDHCHQSSRVSEQEKNEAKTLLRRLLGSKAAVSVSGPGAQSLAAKYFKE